MASKTMVAARMSECETNQTKRGGQTEENGGLITITNYYTLNLILCFIIDMNKWV